MKYKIEMGITFSQKEENIPNINSIRGKLDSKRIV